MFFNEVYVDNKEIIANMQTIYDHQHKAANHLLNITDEAWEEYKYMYNKLDANDRIIHSNFLTKEEKDIVVEFDLETVDHQYINNFLIHLQQIIDETEEIGEFEYGPFKFKINNKIDKSDSKKIITNPKVKKDIPKVSFIITPTKIDTR